jgi:hypothetical protein
MVRILLLLANSVVLLVNTTHAQSFAPRSQDYMFAATANDARAIWVNPAGLATVPEASIMAEFVLLRPVMADLHLSQVTLGFNSQGLSFGYNRERLVTDVSNHTYRVAFARALQAWTVGLAVSHFRSGFNDTGFDAGIRYLLMRSLQLGVVLRNIGQPQVRFETLPATGVVSVGWAVLPRRLELAGEAVAQNRLVGSGIDMGYRAGARLSLAGAMPIAAMTAVSLDSDLGITTWFLGISVGGSRRGVLVAGLAPDDSQLRLETMSLAGIAINPLAARRR